MKDSTFITRIVLKNYKSIAACDVQLQPLTFLVGRNGAGKSNFLDSLRFVADALNLSLDHAVRNRGGINDICRRSRGYPNHFSIRLEFVLPEGLRGHYAFQIRRCPPGGYEVQAEECKVQNKPCCTSEEYFRVKNGTVTDTSVEVAPVAATDRLCLVNAAGLPEFRPVYDAFSRMGFYNLNLDKIRDLQDPDPGDMLLRDGSNLTSVLNQLSPSIATGSCIAAAESLRGRSGLKNDIHSPNDPEAVRDAKGWLDRRMEGSRTYRETQDQPALAALFDIEQARQADSFNKCYRDIVRLLDELRKASDPNNV